MSDSGPADIQEIAVANGFRFSIKLRIYSIIGLSFCGLVGLAAMQTSNLADSLKQQRENELSHLTQLALSIAREEHDAAVRDHSSDDLARKAAAARISKLRYGNDDYFWINDLGPRMIMHPLKPELNGQDLTDNKDPQRQAAVRRIRRYREEAWVRLRRLSMAETRQGHAAAEAVFRHGV
jgi:signal transduction histidine kinase